MRTAIIILLSIATASSTVPLAAQAPARTTSREGWARVEALRPGAEIEVAVRGSLRKERSFVAANAVSITTRDASTGTVEAVAQPQVVEVRILKRHASKGAGAVGGILGGLVGLGVGAAMVSGSGREDYGALVWGPLIGAVAGAVALSHLVRGTTPETIYHAD